MTLREYFKELNEDKNNEVTIEIKCTESAAYDSLLPMLKHIQDSGSAGHSFEIGVDPDRKMCEGREKFGFDGDGPDRIMSIKINSQEYKGKK